MERPPNLHRVSTPLDVHSAQARAAQLDALTDALTLRALSSLAMDAEAGETTAGVAAALSISSDEAERRVAVLLDCELAITSPTNPKAFQPSSDAWTRYRRLFAPGTARPAVTKTPVVDWDGYPRVIRRMADQLARRYRTTFSTETTERYVAETYDELKGVIDGSPTRTDARQPLGRRSAGRGGHDAHVPLGRGARGPLRMRRQLGP